MLTTKGQKFGFWQITLIPTAFFQVPGFTLGSAADDKPARVSTKKEPTTRARKPTVKKAAARESSRKTASARPKR